jgi:hypothetical protein
MHLLTETYDEMTRYKRLRFPPGYKTSVRRSVQIGRQFTFSTDLTNTCSYTSIVPMPLWCARSQLHCTATTTTTTTTTTGTVTTTTTTTNTTKWSERGPCQYKNCLRDGRVGFNSKLRQMWLLVGSENITRQPTMKSLFRTVKSETPPGGVWRMMPTEAKEIFTSSYLVQ